MPSLRPPSDTIDQSGRYGRVLVHHLLSVSLLVLGLLSLAVGFAVVQVADWPILWVAGVVIPLVLLAQWSAWKAKDDLLRPFLKSAPNDVDVFVPEYHRDYAGDTSGVWHVLPVRVRNNGPHTADFYARTQWVRADRSGLMEHGWYDAGWVESDDLRATIPSGSYRDLYVVAVQVAPTNRPMRLVRSVDPWLFHMHAKAMDDGHPIRVQVHQVGCDDPCRDADFAVEIRERAYLVGEEESATRA